MEDLGKTLKHQYVSDVTRDNMEGQNFRDFNFIVDTNYFLAPCLYPVGLKLLVC